MNSCVVERKGRLFDMHENLEAGKRESAGRIEHANTLRIPASAGEYFPRNKR
jgi:hypothetical protein